MSDEANKPDPGWFPDPTGGGGLRWWDGNEWTQKVQDAPPAPDAEPQPVAPPAPVTATTPQPTKEKKPWYQRPLPLVGVGFVALIAIGAIAGGGSEDKTSTSSSDNSTGQANAPATSASTTEAQTTKEEPKPAEDTCGVKATDDCTPHVGPNGVVQVDTLRWRVKNATYTKTIGDQTYGLGEKADGVYLILSLSVRNGKDKSVTLTNDVVQIEVDGNTYDVDNDGTVAAIGDGQDPFFLEDVGPDVTSRGKAVFDIPRSALKKKIEARFNELGFGDTHGYILVEPAAG